jgi:hypothetical protein
VVNSDTLPRQRRRCQRVKKIVLGVQLIRLSWRTKVCTEVNPRVSALHQFGTGCQISVDADEAGFVPAERYEEALPRWIGGGQCAHRLQPTGKAATTLTCTLPPAASRSANYKWLKAWISAGNTSHYVEGLCCRALDTNDEMGLGALRRLSHEPIALGARYLERGWAEGADERGSVNEEEPGPATPGEEDDTLVDTAPCYGDRSSLLTARFDEIEWLRLEDSNLRVAAQWPQPTLNAVRAGEVAVEKRDAVDTSFADTQMAGHGINAAYRKGF